MNTATPPRLLFHQQKHSTGAAAAVVVVVPTFSFNADENCGSSSARTASTPPPGTHGRQKMAPSAENFPAPLWCGLSDHWPQLFGPLLQVGQLRFMLFWPAHTRRCGAVFEFLERSLLHPLRSTQPAAMVGRDCRPGTLVGTSAAGTASALTAGPPTHSANCSR